MNNKTNRYNETFKTWNSVAKLYEDKFMNLDLYNATYDLLCELITRVNPEILEIGCGPGNITKYLISKRPDFKILGLDIAPKMIELAKKNNPSANFGVMDIRRIETIEQKFDAIICGFALPYLSEDDRRKLFENCGILLNTEGILYLSFVEGKYEKSEYKTGSDGRKMFFYYHELNKIKLELIENEFQILHTEKVEYENGKEMHTILILKYKKRKHDKIGKQ